MNKKIGNRTLKFEHPVYIHSAATVVGRKEGEGPLGPLFDYVLKDNLDKEKSWEFTERRLQEYAMELALEKVNWHRKNLDYFLGGDLLNQITPTNFTARSLGVPYFGLYGACSTLVESLILSSMIIDGGFGNRVGVCCSSHHDTAERQLRFPTEMGVQRAMTAQWTVTGSGGYLLSNEVGKVGITYGIPGRVIDLGINNNMDMGSAMAPAASDTILNFFDDTKWAPEDVDLIVTGDLGTLGSSICKNLVLQKGLDLERNYTDCGILVYEPKQDTHSGGSGCGCSAVVLGSYLLPKLQSGELKKILLVGTGALLSPTSTQQGDSIPGIAHGVLIENLI